VVCFLHSPLPDEISMLDYAIRSERVKLVDMGLHVSIPKRTWMARKIMRSIQDQLDQLDCLLIRGPSPLLPEIARSCGSVPTALLLVGDYTAGIEDLPQPGWRKELIRVWSWWNLQRQIRVAQHSLTFVNSRLLYNQLQNQIPNMVETRTTTLENNDFFHRQDTCQKTPFRLLYTGRIDRAKGLFEIVEAMAQLVASGYDLVLDLVGIPAKGDPILDEISALAGSFGVEERVRYHGYKPAGPELLAYYHQADIYITASRASEGFPRTIWEAMASSLPLIATRVGSIPAYIQDAAILAPTKQVDALAQAVKDLITQPDLRQTLIQKGMALARDNTLEKRTGEMISQIECWLESGADKQQG
jgi:glycosyltransferase involved in cell wall biosynthesis